jgi:peptidoglycan/xylan/chitin deacetylase (PgdA/CDA1 family)
MSALSAEVLILMYHAVDPGHGGPDPADPHYTVAGSVFAAQLDALRERGLAIGCARDGLQQGARSGLWLTFDDGDLSNYDSAFPLLASRGLRADFFVNPARVGLTGYCNWAQLREMADAGMSIQSHGMEHHYFTHLSRSALTADLRDSRKAIEDAIGQEVHLLAPPGGRSPVGLDLLARECGYRAVLGSAPGTLGEGQLRGIAPRVAVLASHTPGQVVDWALRGRAALRRQRLRHGLLSGAKRLLGDRGYERMRGALLGGSTG